MKLYFLLFIVFFSFKLYGQESTAQYKALLIDGIAYLQRGDFLKAIEKYKNALKLDSTSVDALYGLGVAYTPLCFQNDGYCSLALTALRRVEKSFGGYRYTYQNMISCLIKKKDYESAIGYCDKSINQDNKNADPYYYKGLAELQLGRSIEGCNDLDRAAKLGQGEAVELQKKSCPK